MNPKSLAPRQRRVCLINTANPGNETTHVIDQTRDASDKTPNIRFTGKDEYVEDSGYCYMEHPSDVGIHAWGYSLEEAFIQAGYALFNYMTDLNDVEVISCRSISIKPEGEGVASLESLLYTYLNELLYIYGSEYFVACCIEIDHINRESNTFTATLMGEKFNLVKHKQGTEVKAITYHEIGVYFSSRTPLSSSCEEKKDFVELKVLLDI